MRRSAFICGRAWLYAGGAWLYCRGARLYSGGVQLYAKGAWLYVEDHGYMTQLLQRPLCFSCNTQLLWFIFQSHDYGLHILYGKLHIYS